MLDKREKITIVDIGISNLLSLKNAIEFCGAKVIVTNKKDVIKKSSKLILPGVGSFQKGIKKENGFSEGRQPERFQESV